jgi:hypothetical protein
LFTIALLSWLAFRWRDHLGEGKDDNMILLMVFILALSVGNHLMAFLAAPALVAFILWVEPRTLINWKLYVTAAIAIILGLSIHLYLPIRAGLDPIINEADPTCPNLSSAIQSVITMGRAGCTALSEALSRSQYQKPPMTLNPIYWPNEVPRDAKLFFAQIVNYFQYFDWQWARSVNGLEGFFGPIRTVITMLFVGLGLYGAVEHFKRDRKSFAYVAVLFLTLSFGLMFYLNFKYGYQYPGHALEEKEVRDRDYFFIVSFSIWGLWAGIGIVALWKWIGEKYLRITRPDEGLPPLMAAPVLAIALIPLIFNWSWASRRHDYSARDWAFNLLNSVEPYGVLFTNGDNDTFPLWYAQEVEGIRKDVTVIVMSYLNTNWYAKQLRDLTSPCDAGESTNQDATRIICQRPFDATRGPKVYSDLMARVDSAGGGSKSPTKTILPLNDVQIDQIANGYAVRTEQPQVFKVSGIETVIPAGTQLLPADQFMAHIINASLGDRPVYYATTTNAFENLNLRNFLVRQGMAFKLNNGPIQVDTARGIVPFPNTELKGWAGEYVDLPRTEHLVSDIFIHRSNMAGWDHWVDEATKNIPFYYWAVHGLLAQLHQSLGNMTLAQKHIRTSEQWNVLATK